MAKKRRPPQAATRVLRTKRIDTLPSGAFGAFDSPSFELARLNAEATAAVLRQAGASAKMVKLLKESLARDGSTLEEIARHHPTSLAELRRIHGRTFASAEAPLHIVNVVPAGGFVLSDTPFTLAITYQNGGHQPCVVASATVLWAGDPFTVEADLVEQQGDGKAAIAQKERHRAGSAAKTFATSSP